MKEPEDEWPDTIMTAEEIKEEICLRGEDDQWLVACQNVLDGNDELVVQNNRLMAVAELWEGNCKQTLRLLRRWRKVAVASLVSSAVLLVLVLLLLCEVMSK